MPQRDDLTTKQIWIGIGLVVLFIVGYIAADQLLAYLNRREQPSVPTPTTTVQTPIIAAPSSSPSDYPDFDSLPKLKRLVLAKDFESWTPGGKISDIKLVTKIVVQKGSLSKGYLFIRASVNGGPLTQWESVYVKMNYRGGHIFRKLSLATPTSNSTQLLFALNQVPYLANGSYSELRSPLFTDWFPLFRDRNEIDVMSFISSLRPAKIDELTLYYQCLNDEKCQLTKK